MILKTENTSVRTAYLSVRSSSRCTWTLQWCCIGLQSSPLRGSPTLVALRVTPPCSTAPSSTKSDKNTPGSSAASRWKLVVVSVWCWLCVRAYRVDICIGPTPPLVFHSSHCSSQPELGLSPSLNPWRQEQGMFLLRARLQYTNTTVAQHINVSLINLFCFGFLFLHFINWIKRNVTNFNLFTISRLFLLTR